MSDQRPYYNPAGHPNVHPIVACLRDPEGYWMLPAPTPFKPLEPGEESRLVNVLRELLALNKPSF